MRRLLMQRFAFDESSVKRKSRTLKTSAATRAKRYLRLSGDDYLQELGAKSETTLDDLAQRQRLLLPAALIGLVATAVVWIFALAFPNLISRVYQFITDSSVPRYGTLLSVLAMAIPFMPPFVSAFALLSMRNVAKEQPESASDVMASFQYAETSNRRWFIVVVAGICGALNCLLLLIALLVRTGN